MGQPRDREGGGSFPDGGGLLIGATAELAELTVLRLDKDFDLIAQITGQPVERINVN